MHVGYAEVAMSSIASNSMEGLTALITGGSSGIGLATARLLVAQGAQVVLVGRQMDVLNEAAQSLECPPDRVFCIHGDVSSEGYANKLIFDTKKKFGAVDILVNCAAAFRGGSILKMSEEDFDFITDVNLKGTWFMSKFAARSMLENGGGAIVNVASTMAAQGSKDLFASAYAASKGGVIALTNALAIELAPKIRVNCVVPGAVQSPMYDLMSHFSDADDLAQSAVLTSEPFADLDSVLATQKQRQSTVNIAPRRSGFLPQQVATVEEVAEAIVALSDPRSDWVTGEKILIGD